jgi:hypothetical protein
MQRPSMPSNWKYIILFVCLCKYKLWLRFEVLKTAIMNMAVLWDVAPQGDSPDSMDSK